MRMLVQRWICLYLCMHEIVIDIISRSHCQPKLPMARRQGISIGTGVSSEGGMYCMRVATRDHTREWELSAMPKRSGHPRGAYKSTMLPGQRRDRDESRGLKRGGSGSPWGWDVALQQFEPTKTV